MAEHTRYYAIVNDFSTRQRPGGVLRRIVHDEGERDEAFTIGLKWEHSPLLYAYERGDLTNKLIPISEEEAMRIVERIRQDIGKDDLCALVRACLLAGLADPWVTGRPPRSSRLDTSCRADKKSRSTRERRRVASA